MDISVRRVALSWCERQAMSRAVQRPVFLSSGQADLRRAARRRMLRCMGGPFRSSALIRISSGSGVGGCGRCPGHDRRNRASSGSEAQQAFAAAAAAQIGFLS
jgi:hypothetical protein